MATPVTPATYAAAISKIAVAEICRAAGYTGASPSALRALSDVAGRHLAAVARAAAAAANGRGRTDCNLLDLVRAVEDLGLLRGFAGAASPSAPLLRSGAVRDVMAFVYSVDETPFPIPIGKKVKNGAVALSKRSFAQAGRDPPLRCVPRWLPCFPEKAENCGQATREQQMPVVRKNGMVPVLEEEVPRWLPCFPEKAANCGQATGKQQMPILRMNGTVPQVEEEVVRGPGPERRKVRFKLGVEKGRIQKKNNKVLMAPWNWGEDG